MRREPTRRRPLHHPLPARETAPDAGVVRGEPAASSRTQPSLLSPREMEVLGLVADGNSTRQIASQLGIAFKTAACHRANIMAKLEVHETASLVRRAIRLGLIEP